MRRIPVLAGLRSHRPRPYQELGRLQLQLYAQHPAAHQPGTHPAERHPAGGAGAGLLWLSAPDEFRRSNAQHALHPPQPVSQQLCERPRDGGAAGSGHLSHPARDERERGHRLVCGRPGLLYGHEHSPLLPGGVHRHRLRVLDRGVCGQHQRSVRHPRFDGGRAQLHLPGGVPAADGLYGHLRVRLYRRLAHRRYRCPDEPVDRSAGGRRFLREGDRSVSAYFPGDRHRSVPAV